MTQRKNGLVIAIDGPSGAGKSTLARLLAQRLGYRQIDTGAMYRALALLLYREGIDLTDSKAVTVFCKGVDIHLDMSDGSQRVLANGEDVSGFIRTQEMSLITSRVSALAPVREAMVRAQRTMGTDGGVVLEGRDIGTVVFPDAELKFYLSASTEERARRRHRELTENGEQVTLEETIDAVDLRDTQDTQRDLAPLIMADDAVSIDSSSMGIEEVLGKMERAFREKTSGREQ